MKRKISIILIVVFILVSSCFFTKVYAKRDNICTIDASLSNDNPKSGEEFELSILATQINEAIAGVGFSLNYDESVLEFVKITNVQGWTISKTENFFTILTTNFEAVTKTGKIGGIIFKAKNNIEATTTNITLTAIQIIENDASSVDLSDITKSLTINHKTSEDKNNQEILNGNANNNQVDSNGSSETNRELNQIANLNTNKKQAIIKLNKTSFKYNNKVQKPTVIIVGNEGKEIELSNYEITYSNKYSKNVGKYTVKVTLKGQYEGTKTLTYKIEPNGTKIKKISKYSKGFKVTWNKQKSQTTGYEIQYSSDKKFKKNNQKVKVNKNKQTSSTIKKLKRNKKYYVRIRTYKKVKVGGKNIKIYSNWSKVKNVTTKK